MRRLDCALWAALGFVLAVPAGASEAEPDPVQALRTGAWNARIRAVAALGRRGESSFPALKSALEDPDWQVRLSAVHWLSSFGPAAAPVLETALEKESCPIVRLAAANKLGGLGSSVAWSEMREDENALAECKSWTWPLTEEYLHTRKKRPKAMEASGVDVRGCQYIQFKNSGRDICPDGFLLKGVGVAPGSIEILYKKKMPRSGVALCCKAGREAATAVAAVPEPEAVECRLHPIECPAPWVEMEPPDNNRFARKDRRFRRTSRIKKGGIVWKHCCRPHQAAGTDYFPKTDYSVARSEVEAQRAAREEPSVELPDYVEERDPLPGGPDAMPEREIARKALAKRTPVRERPALPSPPSEAEPEPEETRPREDEAVRLPEREKGDVGFRESAFEDLLAETRLKPPVGLGPRGEAEAEGEARRESSEREGASPQLDAPPEDLGEREAALPAPKGLPGRSDLTVRGRPGYMEDAGTKVRRDPLPELIRSLRDPSERARSRAADEIGSLGPEGAPALKALKKALKDKSPRVRSSAALALGNVTIGGDGAVKELKGALKDKHLDVRFSAAMALGRVGTEASAEAFEGYMRSAARRFLRSPSDAK